MRKNIITSIIILIFITGCTRFEVTKYPDGTIKSKIPVNKLGDFHGKALFFYKIGSLEKEVSYRNGNIITCKVFYESGELFWKSPYKNNKKNGLYVEYYKNGDIKKKIQFKAGVKKTYEEFDSLNCIVYKFEEINIDSLPDYNTNFLRIGDLTSDSFNTVKIEVPKIHPSQITPIVVNGLVRVKDGVRGIWEIKSNDRDSLVIGLNLLVNDTTEIIYGWSKYPTLGVE